MHKRASLYTILLSAFLLTASQSALSQNAPEISNAAAPTKVYVHRTYQHQEMDRNDRQYAPNLGRVGELKIGDTDRKTIGRYVESFYKTTCNWQHDLTNRKCAEPSPAPKKYMIGYALPDDLIYVDLPQKITSHFKPVPTGYKYVRVENDVVLINASTRDVIDHVTLRSLYNIEE